MPRVAFGAVNWSVLVAYLLAMLIVGAYFTRRASASTDSFFTAGGRVPAWAAGFSIYATTISSITFMSVPEESYLTNWAYAAGTLSIFGIIPLLTHYYIPFFKKLHVTTAYEYLEARFGVVVRSIGSFLYILFHIGRAAIVIYLPTLAITSVSTIDPVVITVAVGVLCTIYTFLGGIEGVIWSDVIQGMLLLLGAIAIVVLGILLVHGGLPTVLHEAVAQRKFITAGSFKLGGAVAAIPIIFVGSVFDSLQQYTASQDVVQRYQATASIKAAGHSVWVNGWLTMIGIPVFFGMGTVLYCFYRQAGGLPAGLDTSALVPYFIVTQMPVGVAGLMIVAIFAASQSNVSSSLNSIAACAVTDFSQRFFPRRSDRADVLLARLVTVAGGAVSIAIAIYMVLVQQAQTWNLFLVVIGLFGVPVAAAFALGIFTTRANSIGTVIGLIVGTGLGFYARYGTSFSPFAVSIAAFVGTYVVGYASSWVFAGAGKSTRGLTVYSLGEGLEGGTR